MHELREVHSAVQNFYILTDFLSNCSINYGQVLKSPIKIVDSSISLSGLPFASCILKYSNKDIRYITVQDCYILLIDLFHYEMTFVILGNIL